MATVTQDPTVASWTPINMWAMLRALINNGTPLLTIDGIKFPIVSGVNGTFAGQAGKGALLIDFTNAVLYMNTGTLLSPTWSTLPSSGGGGGLVDTIIQITANGPIALPTIPPTNFVPITYILNKNASLYNQLSAPIPGALPVGADGVQIKITSNTPYVHVISAIGLLQTGTPAVNYMTFAPYPGASVELEAFNGKWNVWNTNFVATT